MRDSRGSLAHVRLAAVLRLVAGLGRTASVVAEHGPWTLRVWFEQGRLVAAVRSPELGLDALESAEYLFPDGQFVVSDDRLSVDRSLTLTADELSRYLDDTAKQRAELARTVPSLWAVPRIAASGHAGTAPFPEFDGSESWLALIDGRRTVAEIIGTEHPLRHLRELVGLVQQGRVELNRDTTPISPWASSFARDPEDTTAVGRPAPTVIPAQVRAH